MRVLLPQVRHLREEESRMAGEREQGLLMR